MNMQNQGYNSYMNPGINNNLGMPNLDFTSEENGENIKVCVRIRPLNMTEQGRGDNKCVESINNATLQFKNKNINRSYNYNVVFAENTSQEDLFYTCSLNVYIIFIYRN